MAIRNSIKAVIVRNGKVLLTKNQDSRGVFYLLPGGGQEQGETMHEALVRECMEEISCAVQIGGLRFIREYIGKNHEFAEADGGIHQVEFMFDCTLPKDAAPQNGNTPDIMQTGVEWIDLDSLNEIRLYPALLKKALLSEDGPVYLGDTN